MSPLISRRVLGVFAGLALAAACNSTAPSATLTPPQPTFPANGARVISPQATLMATHDGTSGSGDVTDRFEISQSANFAQLVDVGDNIKLDSRGTSYTFRMPPATSDTVYYWRVRSSNSVTTSAFSSPVMFVYGVR